MSTVDEERLMLAFVLNVVALIMNAWVWFQPPDDPKNPYT